MTGKKGLRGRLTQNLQKKNTIIYLLVYSLIIKAAFFKIENSKYYCNQSLKLLTLSLLDRASDRSQKKSQFCGIFRDKFTEKLADFAGNFGATFSKKQLIKNGRFCDYFQGKFRWKSIGFALIRPVFLMFF